MNVIFYKKTEGRKKEFEITTKIVNEGGKLFVIKEGTHSPNHVLNIVEGEKKLSKYLKDYITIGAIENNAYKVPYFKGKTLTDLILEGQVDKAIEIYKNIIGKIPTKPFKDFDEKYNKFYDIVFDDSEESFVVSNYDLTFSNIIVDGKNIRIIDNEWIFDCPIPKKAIIYRALKQVVEHYPNINFPIDSLIKQFNIKSIDKYEELDKQFISHVISSESFRSDFRKNESVFDSSINYSELVDDSNKKALAFNEVNEELGIAKDRINEKNHTISSLESDKQNLQSEIVGLNEELGIAKDRINEKNHTISSLESDKQNLQSEIVGLNEELGIAKDRINEKNHTISSLESDKQNLQSEIVGLNENKKQLQSRVSDLQNDKHNLECKNNELNEIIGDKQRQIYDLDDKLSRSDIDNNELKNHLNNALNEKEMYKIRSENYENSTTFKFMKPFWKLRDKLFPRNSKRRLFLRVIKHAVRHPIWTIKHLNRKNIKKFNKYLKSEGADRCLERIEVYSDRTMAPLGEGFNIQLFNMNKRDNYEELIMPYSKKPLVSIIIPVYNQFSYTYGCLESILKNTQGIKYEIIIGDDCSNDETEHLENYVKNVTIIRNKKNLRFLLNCNNAAKHAKGEYLLFLNNDTNVQEGWLSSLLETINSSKKIGMVGSKLVYPNGRLQEAGGILWKDGSAWNFGSKGDPTVSEYNYRKPVDYISGASIMIRSKLWNKIGGFDERFVPAYCEDSDLAFEVRKAGFEVIYDPFSVVVHYEGISNGTDTSSGVKQYQVENSKKLYEKWKDVLATHPDNAVDVFKARERCYNKKMVLVIDHYVPEFDKDAGSRTVFAYLNVLVDLGYSVKFIGENFYKSEPYTEILEKLGVEVLYGPHYANNYKTWLKDNGKYFDYVILNRPHITAKFIDTVKETCVNAKLIYYGHDLHFLRLQREYEVSKDKNALAESESWKKTELDIYNKVDLIYYPSVIEQEEIKKIDSKLNVKVLQPYVYKNIESTYNPAKRNNLLFVGGFRHGANFDGINWFIKDIFPSIIEKDNDIVLNIVGSYPPQELIDAESKNIHVAGFVDDDELDRYYSEAKLIVVPLRFGAGIKGKVIEAMQHGVPVITTDIGAEGIDATSLVVDNNFEQLLDLYNSNKKLADISKREIEYIKKNYSYDSAMSSIIKDLKELDND